MDNATTGTPPLLLPVSPPEISDPNLGDALLLRAVSALPKSDRDEALADVNCLPREVEESSELVSHSLSRLDQALIELQSKAAYLSAYKLSPDFVSNREIKLKFLRAESFKPVAAARRLASFFEIKLELFGLAKLVQEIKFNDLDGMDVRCIDTGCVQMLENRDQAGRAVVCCWPSKQDNLPTATAQNKLKALYYALMTSLEDESVQKKGAIIINFNSHTSKACESLTLWHTMRLIRCMPVRMLAFHYCHNNLDLHGHLVNLVALSLDDKSRARLRIHYGASDECLASLRSFGIPPQLLQDDIEKQDVENAKQTQQEWFSARKTKEDTDTAKRDTLMLMSRVSDVAPCDVLFGRGKAVQAHPGNRRCRELVEKSTAAYESANRLEKTILAERLVRSIKDADGRFLKQDGDSWINVANSVARDKIAHAFRTQRKTTTSKIEPGHQSQQLVAPLELDTDGKVQASFQLQGRFQSMGAGSQLNALASTKYGAIFAMQGTERKEDVSFSKDDVEGETPV